MDNKIQNQTKTSDWLRMNSSMYNRSYAAKKSYLNVTRV